MLRRIFSTFGVKYRKISPIKIIVCGLHISIGQQSTGEEMVPFV